jgi:hypothetical protein
VKEAKKEEGKMGYSNTLYGLDKLDELTACMFEHYIMHNDIVLMKINHARTATRQSLQEYTNVQSHIESSGRLQKIKKYDELWSVIINLLKKARVSGAGLLKIEKVLSKIPSSIKRYYDELVSQDNTLLLLIKTLASEKYKEAFRMIREINMSRDNEVTDRDGQSDDIFVSASPAYILRRLDKVTW